MWDTTYVAAIFLRMDGSGDSDQAGVEIEDQGHGLGLWFCREYDTRYQDTGYWTLGIRNGIWTWNIRLWQLEPGS